jgi:hypothetical protein
MEETRSSPTPGFLHCCFNNYFIVTNWRFGRVGKTVARHLHFFRQFRRSKPDAVVAVAAPDLLTQYRSAD